MSATQQFVPAGWYDDGQGHQRWWDGYYWGPYAALVYVAPHVRRSWSSISIVGFVLAVAGFFFLPFVVLGALLTLGALVLSIVGICDKGNRGRGFGVAGLSIASFAVLCGIAAYFS